MGTVLPYSRPLRVTLHREEVPSARPASEIAKKIITDVALLFSAEEFDVEHFISNYVDFALATRREMANNTLSATLIVGEVVRVLETAISQNDPSLSAMREIAAVIDNNQEALLKPDYHNIPHYLDVFLFGTALALLNRKFPNFGLRDGYEIPLQWRLTAIDMGDCATASEKHDIFHTGGTNGMRLFKQWLLGTKGRKPVALCPVEKPDYFRHERRSWLKAKPILVDKGYKGARLKRQHIMVFITDPMVGPPLVRLALRYHFASNPADQEQARKESDELVAERFGNNRLIKKLRDELFKDAKTTIMCDVLNKADTELSILPNMIEKTSQWLHRENSIHGGPPITDQNGQPLKKSLEFFLGDIFGLKDRFMLPWAQLLCGAFAKKSAEILGIEIPEGDPGRPQPVWGKPVAAFNH